MTKVISTRLEEESIKQIDLYARELNIDKTSFTRLLLLKGLKQVEQEKNLEHFRNNSYSLGKLADSLGITKWDALILLKEKNIPLPYSQEDLEDDLSAL